MSKPLPTAGRIYLACVIAAGLAVIGYSAWDLARHPIGYTWLVLVALTSFSSTFSIRIPNVAASISVSETFVFICALLFGPSAATIAIAVDGLVTSAWRRQRKPHQMLFNVSEPALSLFIAAHLFFLASGIEVAGTAPIDVGRQILPLVLFTSTYFLLNSASVAGIASIASGRPFWPIWRGHFGWVLLNYFGATSVAALLVHNSRSFNVTALAIVVPLMAISYLTFKTSMQRVEDANRHLQELNKLYLQTIETLAMAVDAKDQITHGHIRRVQALAVGLAKAVGFTDDHQLKALEAAALLHDMGKLAIPEHILNKPGKLSSAEFETMKRHASIGADILSAIEFPYPVVPIVRHHHERWDGRGYPSGLAATDIPMGARILSVVDCFDALTSDRPYRRALSDEQALQMLVDDRGKAYDPLVVDTFQRVHRDIAPREVDHGPHRRTFEEIAEVAHPPVPARATPGDTSADPASHPGLMPILESLQAFSAQTVLAEAADEIARKLRDATPATLCALFVHDGQTGELVLAHASGAEAARIRGMRMRVGERLSGWVAANRRTICNSDPALDLSGAEQPFEGELHSCLSTPLVAGESLVGVLSLYAPDYQAFSEVHRRLFEHISRPLGHLVRGAIELEQVQRATGPRLLAGLPDATSADMSFSENRSRCHVAAVSLRLQGIDERESPSATPGLLLARAAAVLRRDLRAADLLYRDGTHGLLAVLPHADGEAAGTIADRARDSLVGALQALDGPASVRAQVTVGVASTPTDGDSLSAIVTVARRRAQGKPGGLFRLADPPDPSSGHAQPPRLLDEPPAA